MSEKNEQQPATPGSLHPAGYASSSREQKLYDALKRITQYQQPERLRRDAEKLYGLGEEAIEMAYENVIAEASAAIKGMRRPK
jgi:hypothetical protein